MKSIQNSTGLINRLYLIPIDPLEHVPESLDFPFHLPELILELEQSQSSFLLNDVQLPLYYLSVSALLLDVLNVLDESCEAMTFIFQVALVGYLVLLACSEEQVLNYLHSCRLTQMRKS